MRLRFAGELTALPEDIVAILDETAEKTKKFRGTQLITCVNYGGRREIIDAVNKMLAAGETGAGDGRDASEISLSSRRAGSRPDYTNERRAASLELLALAERVQRILFHRKILARFRQAGSSRRGRRLLRKGAALWKSLRNFSIQVPTLQLRAFSSVFYRTCDSGRRHTRRLRVGISSPRRRRSSRSGSSINSSRRASTRRRFS